MIFMINGLQWTGYKKMSFTSVGESACADSWGKALKTGEPALTIPCYAERRYGGVADDELLMAIPPRFLPKVIDGLAALSKNGLRYPVPPYGIQSDAGAGPGRLVRGQGQEGLIAPRPRAGARARCGSAHGLLGSPRCSRPARPVGAAREGGANPPRPRHCNRGRNPRDATGPSRPGRRGE